MINLGDSLMIVNDDVPCNAMKRKFIELLAPTISVSNFLIKRMYKKYNNICLYTYKEYMFLLDFKNNLLQKIYKCLNKNGILKLFIYLNKTIKEKNEDDIIKEKLKTECIFMGFRQVSTEITSSEKGIIINVNAEKPDYECNDNELSAEEDELYNEEEDKKKVVNRVCENCTCGKKYGGKNIVNKVLNDNEEQTVVTTNVESSCGNCYLGDAFRCASCPYKGLPAFQPGEKVKLTLNDESKTD